MANLGKSSVMLLAVLATASCATGVGLKIDTHKSTTPAPAPVAADASTAPVAATLALPSTKSSPAHVVASAQPTTSASGLETARRDDLIASISNVVAASRASKITATLGAVSGVLSNNAATLISNNGSGLLSNNGGSVLANNGSSLIANNGGGLTGKTKYSLFADSGATAASAATGATIVAAATGSASASGTSAVQSTGATAAADMASLLSFSAVHFSAETAALRYEVDAPTATTGGFKSFDKALYHSLPVEQRNTALVDDFIWDNVIALQPFHDDAMKIGMEYHLKKNSSKRIPFSDRMISREVMAIVPSDAGLTTNTVGWEIEFNLDVALTGGTQDHASFLATAGEKDLVIVKQDDGGTMTLPAHLALGGKNDTGTYSGIIDGQDTINIDVTHTTDAGKKTMLSIHTLPNGTSSETITVPSLHLSVGIDVDAKGAGSGHLDDTTGAKPFKIGDITWDTAGVATIVLSDGTSFKATLF